MTKLSEGLTNEPSNVDNVDRDVLLRACRDLIEKQSILAELDADLKKHGFAGSTNIPKLVFLAAISRIFERPVSAVIKGPSSSGKSFSLDAGLRYVPKTAYEKFQGLSDKALVYSTDLDLRHRCLVIGEAAGLAEGNGRAFLRQLLTENEIRYRSVQQTKDGHGSRELVIKGPVGLLMTTTASSLYWEEETRLLSLHVDQSPAQIKRALMSNEGNAPTAPPPEDLSCWHALHQYVCSGSVGVEIPYWTRLADSLPCGQNRVLRDAQKLRALLCAHALLHQRNRRFNDDGDVVATLYDYLIVHELLSEPLAHGLQASVPPHIREVVEGAIQLYAKSGDIPVSTTELAKFLGRDVAVVSRNVKAAIRDGYLDDPDPRQGRRSMIVPGERELPRGTVLPDPTELIEAFGSAPVKAVT